MLPELSDSRRKFLRNIAIMYTIILWAGSIAATFKDQPTSWVVMWVAGFFFHFISLVLGDD